MRPWPTTSSGTCGRRWPARERAAAARGLALRVPRIDVRTGDDTPPARERRRQRRASRARQILITTPESLYLVLGSAARAALATVDTVIVDGSTPWP
ncbi:MAG: hypothetical protein HS111_33090 [Kofleriaceae bacterium]|nr:hypothetical protein [Kofleriaceae bacterium]